MKSRPLSKNAQSDLDVHRALPDKSNGTVPTKTSQPPEPCRSRPGAATNSGLNIRLRSEPRTSLSAVDNSRTTVKTSQLRGEVDIISPKVVSVFKAFELSHFGDMGQSNTPPPKNSPKLKQAPTLDKKHEFETEGSISSIHANASEDSFDSQEFHDFITDIKTMATPKRETEEDFKLKESRSKEISSAKITSRNISRRTADSQTVASTETNDSSPSELVGSQDSLLVDLFSYYFLVPAFDSKGRRITLDQFDKADFEGMSFFANGFHPKSLFITKFDVFILATYAVSLAVIPLILGFNSMISSEFRIRFGIGITIVYLSRLRCDRAHPQISNWKRRNIQHSGI
ncbi:hypothetical protein BDR26DRAFT_405962 [Obelidium mucronatum]|nr:hypothetical protein BDR26DRAFT_405962 [Obelidium mucronatum]